MQWRTERQLEQGVTKYLSNVELMAKTADVCSVGPAWTISMGITMRNIQDIDALETSGYTNKATTLTF